MQRRDSTHASLEYVTLAAAKDTTGTRIVSSALVPSPWSEAAKGLFRIAGLSALVVARGRDGADVTAWTGVDNVPVVLHGEEPPRTNWAAIVALVARLAAPETIVPSAPKARAEVFGVLEMIAGEEGIGWSSRLAMIQNSFDTNGERGFPLPIATYLAKRYGHSTTTNLATVRARVGDQLGVLRDRLAANASRSGYFLGSQPSALDVYTATFLTPLTVLDEACPQIAPPARQAFTSARELLADLVPEELWAHRRMMFERHLPLPIRLS